MNLKLPYAAAQDHPYTIIKSAASFFSGTLLSRVGGLVRDISMAYCFGTSPSVAAFLVAYRFSNLLRRIFGEGVLLNGFIPLFESYRSKDPAEAARFFRDLAFSLSLVLIFTILGLEIGLGLWLFHGVSQNNKEIIYLSMLMLPGLLFVSLFGLFGGLLQCEKKYFLPGVAPLAFNLVWIAAIWVFYGEDSSTAVRGLSVSVVLAFIFQWVMTLPHAIKFFLEKLTWKELFHCRLFPYEVRQMFGAISFGVIGIGATQFNNALDFIFARLLSLEGPAYLNYAIHLYQLPLALFGIGMTVALLPPLSRSVQKKEWDHFHTLLEFSLSKTCLLLLPCSAGLMAVGASTVALIYTHGNFDQEAAAATTLCLWAYSLGLVPAGIAMLLAAPFYAQKDFFTPTIATLTSVALNAALNAVCVYWLEWGAASVALATSLASIWNAYFLFNRLTKKNGYSFSKEFEMEIFKILFCSLIAGGFALGSGHFLTHEPSIQLLTGTGNPLFAVNFFEQVKQFCFASTVFLTSFLTIAISFKALQLKKNMCNN
ncbi:MAG TPA: murein biosynthesis integral membrane protein MurJ [Waddliaceae bacterium]